MLSSSASWTGGIANQNRGTIGGNIVNASPAADSLPALLVYDAELLLVSARGERRVPYAELSYQLPQDAARTRRTDSRHLPEKTIFRLLCPYAQSWSTQRAGDLKSLSWRRLGRLADGIVDDIRLAVGSVAPVPLRLSETERIIEGKPIDPQLIQLGKNDRSRGSPAHRRHSFLRPLSRRCRGQSGCGISGAAGAHRRERAEKLTKCARAMEQFAAGQSRGGNLALLRFESLGARNGSS